MLLFTHVAAFVYAVAFRVEPGVNKFIQMVDIGWHVFQWT